MHKSAIFAICLAVSVAVCDSCSSPEVTSTSFTTQDATIVTNIAYIADFVLKCANGEPSSLYAEVRGNIVPVAVVGKNHYQVSWTEDVKTASSGDRLVRIFDEEGHAAAKKASRAGEDLSTVPSLADLIVNHPGAYNGPWLKSELFATLVSLVVAYFAISFKLKVTA